MTKTFGAIAVVAGLALAGSSAAYAQTQQSTGYQPGIGSPYMSSPAGGGVAAAGMPSGQPQGYNAATQPTYGGTAGFQQGASMQAPAPGSAPASAPASAQGSAQGSGAMGQPSYSAQPAYGTPSTQAYNPGMQQQDARNPAMDYHGASSIYQPNYAGSTMPLGAGTAQPNAGMSSQQSGAAPWTGAQSGTANSAGRPGYIDPGNPCGYGKTCGQP